jgi:hypothetical protein
MNVELEPVLKRCSSGPALKSSSGRIFAIGGSHISRTVGGLVSLNLEVVNLSKPGWIANKKTIAECAEKLATYGFGEKDIVVIDPLSNSVFCGADLEGNPTDPTRGDDGKWHIVGELVFRHKSVLKKTLATCNDIFGKKVPAELYIVAPVPRYVTGKCCTNASHIINFSEPAYIPEINAEIEAIEDLLSGWGQSLTGKTETFSIRCVADNPEASIRDLVFQGQPMWLEPDPVHCAGPAYLALAHVIHGQMLSEPE